MRPYEAECLAMDAAKRMLARLPRRFVQHDDGTITVFAAMVFVLMVGVGGIAIDLMRYETQRLQLHYNLDRAVLAAAALNQTEDPETVVRNYFDTAGLGDYRLRVTVENNLNARRVIAQAEIEVQTIFMQLFGQRVLSSPAAGAAEDRIRNVEVSLVLDISGSMDDANRMINLKPAAREFVTTILEANNNPDGDQLVSVSIVPYSSQVNVGTTLASVFNLTNEHNYSRCVRFADHHFAASGLDPTVALQRMAHLDWEWSINWSDPIVGRYTCPRNNYAAILPWSNSEGALHALIDSLQPSGSTAIDAGMRWGVALLDPLARPALAGLRANGTVHADFENRPAAYNDPETLKVVVLMTDGDNREQYDVNPLYRSGPSPFWRDPDDGDFSVFYPQWNLFWQEDAKRWRTTPDGGGNNNAVQLDYADLWNHIPAEEVREDLFNSDAWTSGSNNGWRRSAVEAMGNLYEWSDIVDIFVTPDDGDQRLRQLCGVANANDIMVFTIAFEAPPRGQQVMRDCASTDAHFFDAQGVNISTVFASIARTINQLRLVQ